VVVDPPGPSEGDVVTSIVIPGGAPDSGGPPIDIDAHDWGESDYTREGTDAIACYVPWHASPQRWGIYFFERPFFAFVKSIAADAVLPANTLAPVVLRQVLFHELTHFRFEVVCSELEDVFRQSLYLDYLRYRFGYPAEGLEGPIEESIANWNEVRFAGGKLQQFLRPKPATYLPAVKNAATAAPPGYREWKAASTDRRRERLIAAVASLIADRPITTGGWGGWVTEESHWVGDPALLPCVHALEKSAPQATIRTFEKWLRKQGIDPFPGGNGSHRRFEYAGRRDGYGVSGNSDHLYFKDAKRLAKFFGYPTVQDFLIAVSTKAALPARAEFELAAA
jgi:hypothetical protein